MWQWLTLREHITDGRLEAVIVARVNMAPRLARAIASSVVQGPAAFGLAVASYSLAVESYSPVAECCSPVVERYRLAADRCSPVVERCRPVAERYSPGR